MTVTRPGAGRRLAGWPVIVTRPGGACSVMLRTESATTEILPGWAGRRMVAIVVASAPASTTASTAASATPGERHGGGGALGQGLGSRPLPSPGRPGNACAEPVKPGGQGYLRAVSE